MTDERVSYVREYSFFTVSMYVKAYQKCVLIFVRGL